MLRYGLAFQLDYMSVLRLDFPEIGQWDSSMKLLGSLKDCRTGQWDSSMKLLGSLKDCRTMEQP